MPPCSRASARAVWVSQRWGVGEEEQVDEVWLEAKISVLGTDQPGFFVNVFPCTLIILKKTLAANSRICL